MLTARVWCLLYVILLLGLVNSVPIPSNDDCPDSAILPPGQEYTYAWEGENVLKNANSEPRLLAKAIVKVTVHTPCWVSVKLAQTSLNGVSDHERQILQSDLEKETVWLRFEEGTVTSLRHSPSANQWAINVIRAIASSLQVSWDGVDTKTLRTEHDVLGACATMFNPTPVAGGQTSVIKFKSLNSCSGRVGSPRISAFSIPYDSKSSALQSIPLTRGNYSCTLTVNEDKWITKSECVQKELLLVSVSSMAADELWSTSRTSLSLMETSPVTAPLSGPDASYVSTTLEFDHNIKMDETTSEREALLALDELCQSALADTLVKPQASEAFSRLIRSLRGLSYDAMTRVYMTATSGELCFASGKLGSLFVDALPSVGTEASIRHQLHLLHQEGSDRERYESWLTSMALTPQPTDGMIEAFVPYVRTLNIPRVLFAATSVAHTFCMTQENCEQVPAVRDLVAAISKHIGYKCRNSDEKLTVMALKAFGNMGIYGEALNSVLECAISPEASMEVRLAAVASFRRSCQPEAMQKLFEIYSSSAEDSELRIMAYLNIIRCADYVTLEKILDIHSRENVNQVGSFVSSHLSNLQNTNDPEKRRLRSYLSRVTLENKWSNDPRKFSKNFQFSKFSEPWNAGGNADMNLIYSPKSFVPRSLNLNLTVNLFSRSVNLFEIGARAEGFDSMIEKIAQVFDGNSDDLMDGLMNSKRMKRALLSNDIFDSKVKPDNLEQDAFVSVYSRVFGNELSYMNFEDIVDYMGSFDKFNKINAFSNDIVKSGMLIDTALCMSTATGFPLHMSINATSTVALKTEVKFMNKNTFGIEGSIQPSAVVEMNSEVATLVGNRGYRLGVRVTSRLHAATVLSGHAKFNPDQELSIKIDTPREELQVVSVKSTFFVVEGETAKQVDHSPAHKSLDGCTESFDTVLGLRVCVRGVVPKPFFGPQGVALPFDVSVSVEKNDPNMEGYIMQAKWTQTPARKGYTLLFDTPGSSINRKISLEALMEYDGHLVLPKKMILQSTIADFRTSYLRMKTDVVAESETNKQFSIAIEADCHSPGQESEHPLSLTFVSKYSQTEEDETTKFEIVSVLPTLPSLNINGEYKHGILGTSVELNTNLPRPYKILAIAGKSGENYNTFTGSIKVLEDSRAIVDVLTRIKKEELPSAMSALAEAKFLNAPDWDMRFTAECKSNPGIQREYDFNFNWGQQLINKAQLLAMSKVSGEWGYGKKGEAHNRFLVVVPTLNLDADLRVDTNVDLVDGTPDISQIGKIIWAGETIAESRFEFVNDDPIVKIKGSLMFPGAKISYRDEITKLGRSEYKGTTVVEWGLEPDDKKIELAYKLKATDPASGAIVNHELETSLSYPGSEKPITTKQKVRVTREAVDITMQADQGAAAEDKFVSIDIKVAPGKSSDIEMETPGMKLKYSRVIEGVTTNINMELYPRRFSDRKIVHTCTITKDKAARHYAVNSLWLWNADKDPNSKLKLDFDTKRGDRRQTTIDLEHMNLVKLTWRSDLPPFGTKLKGQSSIEWKLGGTMVLPREFMMNSNREPANGMLKLKYNRAGKDVLDIDYNRKQTEEDRTFDVVIKSMNPKTGQNVGWTLHSKRALKGRNIDLKLVAEPSGRTYELFLDDKTADGKIDIKLRTAYPWPKTGKWVNHEYITTGTYADHTYNFETTFTAAYHNSPTDLNDTPKKYLIKGTLIRPKRRHLTIDGTVASLDNPSKTGTIRLNYALDITPMDTPAGSALRMPLGNVSYDAELKLVLGAETLVDYAANYKYEDVQTFNGGGRLTAKGLPNYNWKVSGKAEGDGRKYSIRVKKNDVEEYIKGDIDVTKTDAKYKLVADWQSPRVGKAHLSLERSVLQGDNHRQYNIAFNCDKLPEPYVIEAETERKDGNKVTNLNVCRGKTAPQCVGINIQRNVDWDFWRNKQALIKVTQQPDLTMEIDYLFKLDKHEARSKIIFDVNKKKLGHDFTCHHEPEKLSRQHMLMFIAEREMEFLRERKTDDKNFEFTWSGALNKKEMPDRKALVHYKRTYVEGGDGYNSEGTISHPAFGKPINMKGSVLRKPDANTLFKIEAELDPASPENAMHFHLQRRINDITPRNRSLHIHLHHHDKNVFDWSMTAYRCNSMELPIFGGYWWHYQTAKGERRQGHMTLLRDETGKGRLEISSPYQGDIVVESEAKDADADGVIRAKLQVTKNGEPARTGDIEYKLSKAPPMAIVNATFKNPEGKNTRAVSFKFAPEEGDLFNLELSSFPNDQKTLDIRASVERRGDSMYRTQLYFPPSYVNHLREVMKGAAEKAGQYPVEKIKEELKSRANAVSKAFNNKIRTPFLEFLVDELSQLHGEVTGAINDILETNVGKRWHERLERVRAILTKIIEKIREEINRIKAQKRSKRSIDLPEQIHAKFEPLRMYLHSSMKDWYSQSWLRQQVDSASSWVAQKTSMWAERFVSFYNSRVYEPFLNKVMANVDLNGIVTAWRELYQPAWPHARSTFFQRLVHFAPPTSTRSLAGRSRVIEWDRARGVFVADIDAPMTIEDARQIWNYGLAHRHEEKKVEIAPKPLTLLAVGLKQPWLPPFDARAFIMDGRHFITFDGRTFSALGDCTYLLARDFEDKKFALSIKYGSAGSVSYILNMNDRTLELFPEKRAVTMNEKQVDLPIVTPEGVLAINSHDSITIGNVAKGIQITCFLHHDVCAVDISGWKFGKTRGLLGTYDNEPFNDLMRPQGQITDNVAQFMRKWEMEEECPGRPRDLSVDTQSATSDAIQMCSEVFKTTTSPLAIGFWLRNPQQYYQLCLRQVSLAESEDDKRNAMCQVSMAYALFLQPLGLSPSLPNQCMMCDVESSSDTMMLGETRETTDSSTSIRSADIVFVVEEAQCNEPLVRELDSTVSILEKELNAVDITRNRYALMSFGQNSIPMLRTARDRIFFRAHDLPIAASKLSTSDPVRTVEQGDDMDQLDVFGALAAAVDAPWRQGVAKTVVLLACSKCDDNVGMISYSDLQRYLLDHGISLHVVGHRALRIQASEAKNKGLFGFDAESVYSVRDMHQKTLIGSPELLQHVSVEQKDLCVALARETHGVYFSSQNAISGEHTKKWKTVVARRLARGLQTSVDEETCQMCECSHTTMWAPRTICKPCTPRRPKIPKTQLLESLLWF